MVSTDPIRTKNRRSIENTYDHNSTIRRYNTIGSSVCAFYHGYLKISECGIACRSKNTELRLHMKFVYRFFFQTVFGWRIQDDRPAVLPSYIVVVAPHTSNWDFWVGICVRSLANMEDVKYLAKASLFKPPLGWFFRAMGGYPVNRSKSAYLVENIIAMFKSGEITKITITPEGTRKYQPNWKTGFHRIATGANVPIVLCTFDYAQKLAILSEPFPLTDDVESDIERMKDWFRPHKGKIPENGVR